MCTCGCVSYACVSISMCKTVYLFPKDPTGHRSLIQVSKRFKFQKCYLSQREIVLLCL